MGTPVPPVVFAVGIEQSNPLVTSAVSIRVDADGQQFRADVGPLVLLFPIADNARFHPDFVTDRAKRLGSLLSSYGIDHDELNTSCVRYLASGLADEP